MCLSRILKVFATANGNDNVRVEKECIPSCQTIFGRKTTRDANYVFGVFQNQISTEIFKSEMHFNSG